jgi:hypothetical protein
LVCRSDECNEIPKPDERPKWGGNIGPGSGESGGFAGLAAVVVRRFSKIRTLKSTLADEIIATAAHVDARLAAAVSSRNRA